MDHPQRLASVCGLFCPSCTVYIGTQQDARRLAAIATNFGCSVDDMRCHGCRSERRALHCRDCSFVSCAEQHQVAFCGECVEFPCEALRDFQAKMPHRRELWQAHQRLSEVGVAVWCEEMTERYACRSCGTLNSAYDLSCRSCGHSPGNDFVATHHDAIVEYLSRKKLG